MRFFLILSVSLLLVSGCARAVRPSVVVPTPQPVSSTTEKAVDTLSIGMIALGDGSTTGDVGCGDSRVVVSTPVTPPRTMTTEEKVRTALNALFVADNPYGESGLSNILAQSENLTVSDVVVDGDTITVSITGQMQSGGVCDDPRIIDQLRTTVQKNSDQSTVVIFINGVSLDTYFHG